MLARQQFHGNVLEAVENLLPAVGALYVGQPKIMLAAQIAFEHRLSVDQQHQRGSVLHLAVVQADVKVEETEAIFAVGRDTVREFDPATHSRGERQGRVLVAFRLKRHAGDGRGHIPDTCFRQVARCCQVLIEESRRGSQRFGDIVEPFDLNVLRQDLLLIHVHADKRLHGGCVLSAIQALNRHISGLRTLNLRALLI